MSLASKDPQQTADDGVPIRPITLSPSIIPSEDSIAFQESSFFARNSQSLPSPDQVRAETERRHPGNPCNGYSPLPVHYPHLGLTVKYGKRTVIAEVNVSGQFVAYSVTLSRYRRSMTGRRIKALRSYTWNTSRGKPWRVDGASFLNPKG